jgi:hypothetical protein
MFFLQDKAKSVLLLAELKSVTLVKCTFGYIFHRDPPHKNIKRWYKQFEETGNVQKQDQQVGHRFQKKKLNASYSLAFTVPKN